MANIDLQAKKRDGRGKNDSRRLRHEGMAPAVLYGDSTGSEGSTAIIIPAKTVDYTLSHIGDNALYDIDLGEGTATARIVDVQRNPVSGILTHVDFAPVNMRERIEITVPISVIGDAPGVDEEGGVWQQVAYEVQVESLPGDIPQEIEVDVSSLGLNENLTLGDLTLPNGVELLSEAEEVAVTITQPTEITDEEMEEAGIVEDLSDEEEAAAAEDGEEATADESTTEAGDEPQEAGDGN
ncbi:MAG: 50S ribosomal protein L25 [Rubrobacteraceae bacterium]